jgi:hypothetical protein
MPLNPLGTTNVMVSRLGLGMAALGRPGYINLGYCDERLHLPCRAASRRAGDCRADRGAEQRCSALAGDRCREGHHVGRDQGWHRACREPARRCGWHCDRRCAGVSRTAGSLERRDQVVDHVLTYSGASCGRAASRQGSGNAGLMRLTRPPRSSVAAQRSMADRRCRSRRSNTMSVRMAKSPTTAAPCRT